MNSFHPYKDFLKNANIYTADSTAFTKQLSHNQFSLSALPPKYRKRYQVNSNPTKRLQRTSNKKRTLINTNNDFRFESKRSVKDSRNFIPSLFPIPKKSDVQEKTIYKKKYGKEDDPIILSSSPSSSRSPSPLPHSKPSYIGKPFLSSTTTKSFATATEKKPKFLFIDNKKFHIDQSKLQPVKHSQTDVLIKQLEKVQLDIHKSVDKFTSLQQKQQETRQRIINEKKDEERKRKIRLIDNAPKILENKNDFLILSDEFWKESKQIVNGVIIPPKFQVDDNEILSKDLRTLKNGEWLNDEIINSYLTLICNRSKKKSNLPSCYHFNTFFYTNLRDKGYNSVRRWTRRINVFKFDIIIVPLHLHVHWVLAIIDNRIKTIKIYDSFSGDNTKAGQLLFQYLISEMKDKLKTDLNKDEWKVHIYPKDVPQQSNSYDCGVFLCKNADFLARDAKLIFNQDHIPYFRTRMCHEIMKKQLLS
ncbi:hypothetical protein SNEBB_005430 [Seison nebaliae]|nr:hypothetical protein SNEBB_005430 [Seison nebaliae]